MTSTKKFDKICLFCRKEYVAQKRTTKYCGHHCASRAYKIKKRDLAVIESNFDEFVKKELLTHSLILNEIQISLSELIKNQKVSKSKYLTPDDFCELNNISRKTLSRWIKDKKVEVKQLSSRKYLIKSNLI